MTSESSTPLFIAKNQNGELLKDTISPNSPSNQLRIAHLFLSHFDVLSQEASRVIHSVLEQLAPTSEKYRAYLLSNKDIVCIFTGLKIQTVRSEISTVLRRAKIPETLKEKNAYGLDQTLSIVDFHSNVLRLASYVEMRIEDVKLFREETEKKTHHISETQKIDMEHYAKLISQIGQLDLTHFMRFRSIYDIHRSDDHLEDTELYSEASVDTHDITRRALPDVDLEATPWLHRHWKSQVAEATFKHLAREITKHSATQIGIFLPMSMTVSDAFKKLQEQLPINMRGRVILEIDVLDYIANHERYSHQIDALRANDFLICIDKVTPDLFVQLDFSHAPIQFLKIIWQSHVSKWSDDFREQFENKLEQLGSNVGIIATNVHRFSGLIDAVDLGITYVEGSTITLLHKRRIPIYESAQNSLKGEVRKLG